MASPSKLTEFSWMMQGHMNVEDCPALDSTPFMLIVSFLYSPVVRHLGIILITPHK